MGMSMVSPELRATPASYPGLHQDLQAHPVLTVTAVEVIMEVKAPVPGMGKDSRAPIGSNKEVGRWQA